MVQGMAVIRRWLAVLVLVSGPAADAAETVHPELWPAGNKSLLIRPAIETKITRRLAGMSLEDKIGQMIQADIETIRPEDLKTHHLGALLAGGNAAPDMNVRAAPQAWLEMIQAFDAAARGAGAIPPFFGIDAVHGDAKIIGATIFPHNIGLGAAHDGELVRRVAQATAEEVAVIGADWTFAPTVAVLRDPRWGRAYESYSEAPDDVARLARQAVEGLQGQFGAKDFLAPGHVLASAKHFVGDGGTRDGRDQGDNIGSESELARIHSAGYRSAIAAGAMIVMVSYNSWHGGKMMAARALLTDILKNRMGFGGVVVGDWNAHEQVPGCTKFDCPEAINAGVDMLMATEGSWRGVYDNLLREAHSGTIPMKRIDDAVRRILRVKYLSGAFERPSPALRPDAGKFEILGSAAHRALAREAVRKSLVLLKNEPGLLPIAPSRKILVAGPQAIDLKSQMGGWTIDWQGDLNVNADFPGAVTILDAIKKRADNVAYSPDGRFDERPDVAIVVFGELPYAEYEGDLENLAFSRRDATGLALLRKLKVAGIPTVSLFLSGRPLWVNPELNASDVFIAAWLPGAQGDGIADLIFPGPYDFTGRLPASWPLTAMPVGLDGQDHGSGALFSRGYGLARSQASALGVLPEDPAIPERYENEDTLFRAGHVTAPWSIFAADEASATRLTTDRQSSPLGAVAAGLEGANATARWPGGRTGTLRFFGRAMDLRGRGLALRYRLDAKPDRPVLIEIGCKKDCVAALDVTATLEPGGWRSLELPYSCFARTGADLSIVDVPLAITTSAHMTLEIERAGFVAPAKGSCPP